MNNPRPRYLEANRAQLALRSVDLEGLVPGNHEVRAVWAYVESLDLGPLYGQIQSVEGEAGRPAIDPRILMGLWLWATLDAVGSAREIERLCQEHQVYQWICGGVGVNHHTLSDFRVEHEKFLDEQLTHSVATLMAEGLVEMERVAVDGVRVRASAGSGSFHREKSLKESLKMAKEQVEALKKELREEPGAGMRRKEAAQKRVAEQRVKRIEAALKKHEKLKEEKKGKEEKEPRASTTDAEARVMKMADGGFRPAYNVQMGTDTKSQIILGVEVLTRGSDRGEGGPMVGQLEKRYGRKPKDVLVDGGYIQYKDFEEMAEKGCRVYAPVKKPKEEGHNPYEPLETDGVVIEEWKRRMGTLEAKTIYKQRASTAECVNAIARNRGLQQFLVRGVEKVRCVALWLALAHNVMRIFYLRKVAAEGI